MELTQQQHAILVAWIKNGLIKVEREDCSSYNTGELRHFFQFSENGFFIDNSTFNHAMQYCGYRVRSKDGDHWRFYISQESPAFRKPGHR